MSARDARLAVEGGSPVRSELLPYGRQAVTEEDVQAVVEALRSSWLTTGPRVEAFEQAFATAVGAAEAVAVSSGTAALHAAVHAAGVGPGDEVVVPAITFAATANAVVFAGGRPIFADVAEETLLIDPASVAERAGERTRAIIAVDYAGQPCDYGALAPIARDTGCALIADACHALGAADGARAVGSLADLSTFSFHPVKAMTTAEGGMVTTDRSELATRMRRFRNHGISSDHRQRSAAGSWYYEMVELGYNYRLSDLQCALGLAQLTRLPAWVERRQAIAARYDAAFAGLEGVDPLRSRRGATHAYHLYVVRLSGSLGERRQEVFAALRAEGLGVNVHYIPVHLHPFYRQRFGTGEGLCPRAEAAYRRILSLPLFPAMSDEDATDVIDAVTKVARRYGGVRLRSGASA